MLENAPPMLYGGLTALALFIAAALVPKLNARGTIKVSPAWHMRLAGLGLLVALFHAYAAISKYL